MIPANLLYRLRTDLPMSIAIANLGRLAPPAKEIESYFRFLCPHCHELRYSVNPRNNHAHCFCCKQNCNNIDLLLTLGYDFRTAVNLLEQWLRQHDQTAARRSTSSR